MSASTNINKVYFNGKTSAYAERVLYQWDYGQVLQFPDLELPAVYQVHFSTAPTAGSAYDMLGTADGVSIPDSLLEEGKPIYAWIFLHAGEDDGETVRVAVIYVKPRSKPISETPTPAQQSAWDEAISALSAALEEAQALAEAIPEEIDSALAAAKASGEFDGADGADGNSVWWTVSLISDESMPGQVRGKIRSSWLKGRSGTPAVHDLVVGPAVGTSGSIVWLYEIISVAGIYSNLHGIGSIKGDPGDPGDPGEPGFAPVVTIETITGGHRVTITSAAHPEGQSFDVMDGSGGGGGVTVDDEISGTSENPVQNKVIKAALDGKYTKPSGGIPSTDLATAVQNSLVFACTYGTTTNAEIEAAYQAGKEVIVAYNSKIYRLVYRGSATSHTFSYFNDSSATTGQQVSCSSDTWSAATSHELIRAPSSPTAGDFLCWNGSAWAATTLTAWQGGNYGS